MHLSVYLWMFVRIYVCVCICVCLCEFMSKNSYMWQDMTGQDNTIEMKMSTKRMREWEKIIC